MKPLLRDVLATPACMEAAARTLDQVSTVLAHLTMLELAVSMSMMLVKPTHARMELPALTMELATSAFVHLATLVKTVMRILWTARRILAHPQLLVLI